MHCQNCGKKIREGIQFCPNCGAPVRNKQETEPEWEEYEDDYSEEENAAPKKRKWKWIAAVIAGVCIAAGASGLFVNAKIKDNKYEQKIEEARDCVQQEKYDDAITIYRDSITIRPRRDTAYLELADVYTTQGQPEMALEVLKEAKTKTKSKEVKKKYQKVEETVNQNTTAGNGNEEEKEDSKPQSDPAFKAYIEQTLIPSYGSSKGGRFGLAYDFSILGETELYNSQKPPGAFGLLSAMETDLDGDGVSELITVRITADGQPDRHMYYDHLYVQVFKKDGDQVIELQQPKRTMQYGIMGIAESGNLNVFVKEENGAKFLCILNCARSSVHEFKYEMYMDLMQLEGNAIVCRKSVTMGGNEIYDTTELSLEEAFVQGVAQGSVLYQTDPSNLNDADTWYSGLIEPFENEIKQYVDLRDILSVYFNSDLVNMESWSRSKSLPLPYDFGFSEYFKGVSDVFRLRSVWAENEGMQYWDCLDYTKKQETDAQTVRDAYNGIINEYREAIAAGAGASETQFLDVNRLGVELSGYSSDKIFYGFYDINSDGTEELLIGYDYSGSDMTVMDIYAYDGSIARKLMYDDTMAERSPTKIYGDGTIYKYSSGGAQYGGAYFYKLNQPEYAAVLYEFYRQDGAAYPATPYYNETEQLTQEQFDAKIAALGEPINIVWNNIATDVGTDEQAGQETEPQNEAVDMTGDYIGSIPCPAPPIKDYSFTAYNKDNSYECIVIYVENIDNANFKFHLTRAVQDDVTGNISEETIFNEHIAHYNGEGYYEYIGTDCHLYFKYRDEGELYADKLLDVYGCGGLYNTGQYGWFDEIFYNNISGTTFMMNYPFAG